MFTHVFTLIYSIFYRKKNKFNSGNQKIYQLSKMPRAKAKAPTLGNSLKSTGKQNKKRERRENYQERDYTETNEKFGQYQNNQVSITEQSDIQVFLQRAELANRDFTTERSKRNVQMLNTLQENPGMTKDEVLAEMLEQEAEAGDLELDTIPEDEHGNVLNQSAFVKLDADGNKIIETVLTEEELKNIRENKLTLPRKPIWNRDMTKEELIEKENMSFLEWRRSLAILEEESFDEGNDQRSKFLGNVTPYEKNLDFWRQLWRVVEYSDVLIQILDCRNPLLFYSSDLVKYVKEISERQEKTKFNILLLNKADLLSETQRKFWENYWTEC